MTVAMNSDGGVGLNRMRESGLLQLFPVVSTGDGTGAALCVGGLWLGAEVFSPKDSSRQYESTQTSLMKDRKLDLGSSRECEGETDDGFFFWGEVVLQGECK